MGSRTLSVTKLLSRGVGMPIVVAKRGASVDEIASLHTTLPGLAGAGPGTYRFEVFDETGPDKDTWVAKLGPDIPEVSMPAFGSSSLPDLGAAAGVGAPGAARPVGGGYFYDDSLGLLITPQKQAIPWRPGEPFPGQLPQAAAQASPWGAPPWGGGAANSTLPPWMNPWGSLGWGQMPVGEDKNDRELRELKAKLEARDRDDVHKKEIDALKAAIDAQNGRFEKLIEKLSEKPQGPSPEVTALNAQLEELRRQNAEQRASAEAARREDTLRAEIKATNDRFETILREVKDSKPDPMVPLLTQIVSSQQAATQATVGAMQKASEAQAEAAKENARAFAERLSGSMLTPERTLEMLKLAKDRTPESEVNKGLIDMFRTTFGMAQEVVKMQADAMNAQNGPAWVPFAQQALDGVGQVARAYVATKAAETARAEREDAHTARAQAGARAAREGGRASAQPGVNGAGAGAGAGAPASAAAPRRRAPQPPPEREMSPEEIRNQAAERVFGKQSADQRAAQARANGAGAPVAATPPPPVAPTAAAAPAPAAGGATVTPIRRRRASAPASAPAPAPAPTPPAPTPVETQAAAQIDLRKLTPEQLRPVVEQYWPDDESFFGPALSQIERLRAANLPPDEAANAVLMSRQYFAAYGELPPAVELLNAGHVELLCERIFPEAAPDYRAAVGDALRVGLHEDVAEEEDGAEVEA
jgi:hypothetical protein